MKTILVDDEPWALSELEDVCKAIPDFQLVGSFIDPIEALEYAKNNPVELAFLDVEMPLMLGHELSEQLRVLYPDIVIIFVTAFSEHLGSSIAAQADYFILKPFTAETMETTLQRALLFSRRNKKKLCVRTFGRFDVFVNDRPVVFSSQKAKELVAFIVSGAGGILTPREMFDAVWSELDQDYNNYTAATYRKMMKRVECTLAEAGCSNLLLASGGERALNIEACDCDLVDFLKGDEWAIASYQGHYLNEFTWSEKQRQQLNGMKVDYLKTINNQ